MSTVKVAIAVEAGQVAPHFGRCESYLVADVTDGRIGMRQQVQSPGHEPGVLPAMLHDLGVECVVAGGMGAGARRVLEARGIAAITGAEGPATEVLSSYAAGALAPSGTQCEGHGCGPHHNGGCSDEHGQCLCHTEREEQ